MWPSYYCNIESLIKDSNSNHSTSHLNSLVGDDKRSLHQKWTLFNQFISNSNHQSNHMNNSMLPFYFFLPSYFYNSKVIQAPWLISPPRSPDLSENSKFFHLNFFSFILFFDSLF